MLERGLRSVLAHTSQADDNADAVLLNSYAKYYCSGNLHGN